MESNKKCDYTFHLLIKQNLNLYLDDGGIEVSKF